MTADGDYFEVEREILLLEYERSSEFCNHVDNVRNVITSFYLTIVGAAALVIDRYSSADLKTGPLGGPEVRVVVLLYCVAIIGVLFVLVLGRLRRVQIERYQLMNRILDSVLSPTHRGIVGFDDVGILGGSASSALRTRTTGSYFWTLVIILPSAGLVGTATFLITGLLAGLLVGVAYVAACDYLVFKVARR